MAKAQKSDGDWYVTYWGDGRPCLLWEQGSEMMGGHFLKAVEEYETQTNDRFFSQNYTGVLKKAADFLVNRISKTGLLKPNKDLWETYDDKSWTYTNATFIGGLNAAGKLLDTPAYRQAADTIKTALLKYALTSNGYFGKGVNPNTLKADPICDASVLGLAWPYKVVEPQSPAMLKTLDTFFSVLGKNGSRGINRWNGDNWYGGEEWPELTDWQSLIENQAGRRDRALKLHQLNTDAALTTGSLQLGEVYDRARKRFTSAFPLGWPEAQYLITQDSLYK
jgi:glucoamylase